jgi:hypothetical protein
MTTLLLLVASLPCVYWTLGIETRATLEAAAIKRLCVPPERADSWRAAGFTVTPVSEAELASREALPAPGIASRAGLASPTRSPWIVANGWRFARHPGAKYVYDVPAGKAALAAAEAFAYGADVVLKIDPADVGRLGEMLTFLEALPAVDLPTVSDVTIVDDGSAITGEVMNLLGRRNLLFRVLPPESPRSEGTIRIGTPEYPREEAADPNGFALKIRRQISDERRTLRVYGSEVVIGRLTGDAGRARLHLINYGGREINGLGIRLRVIYADGEAHVAGAGRLPLQDHVVAGGATEFSVPQIVTYAVIDLTASR